MSETETAKLTRLEREHRAAIKRDVDRVQVFIHTMGTAPSFIAQYRMFPDDEWIGEVLAQLSDHDRAMFIAHQAKILLPDAPPALGAAHELAQLLQQATYLAQQVEDEAASARALAVRAEREAATAASQEDDR
jgi:hypothetical protein